LIDVDGTQVGIVPLEKARNLADERGLDLVEVSPNAVPPVCKIMDLGKFRYEQHKREKEALKKARQAELKTLRMRPATDKHDFETKLRTARKFLGEGRKVRFILRFRGREMAHQDIGREKLLAIGAECGDIAEIEQHPSTEGRAMTMVLSPKTH
jgi:translation initiation factor IF-3